jgi:hypothetical protein
MASLKPKRFCKILLQTWAIQRPLAALGELEIPNSATYAAAKKDLEKTGVAEAVNKCGEACADFNEKLNKWTKHSSNTKLSLRDRLSVGVWNKEKIRTFRTRVQSCQAIVQFSVESTQLYVQTPYCPSQNLKILSKTRSAPV